MYIPMQTKTWKLEKCISESRYMTYSDNIIHLHLVVRLTKELDFQGN